MDSVSVDDQPGQRQWPGACLASFGIRKEKKNGQNLKNLV